MRMRSNYRLSCWISSRFVTRNMGRARRQPSHSRSMILTAIFPEHIIGSLLAKKTRPAKLTGIVAVRGWPGKHLDRDGTGYAGFARAVAARDGDADPSMPRGWPTPARARRSGAAASR